MVPYGTLPLLDAGAEETLQCVAGVWPGRPIELADPARKDDGRTASEEKVQMEHLEFLCDLLSDPRSPDAEAAIKRHRNSLGPMWADASFARLLEGAARSSSASVVVRALVETSPPEAVHCFLLGGLEGGLVTRLAACAPGCQFLETVAFLCARSTVCMVARALARSLLEGSLDVSQQHVQELLLVLLRARQPFLATAIARCSHESAEALLSSAYGDDLADALDGYPAHTGLHEYLKLHMTRRKQGRRSR